MSIVAIVTLSWQGASAQEVGNWDLYPIFSGEKLQKIIDTRNVVYYLSDNFDVLVVTPSISLLRRCRQPFQCNHYTYQ